MNKLTIIPPPSAKDRDLVDELNGLHEKVEDECQHSLESIHKALFLGWQAGRLLIEQKALVRRQYGHGHWLPWLHANFQGSERNAQRYMWIAKSANGMADLEKLAIRQGARKLGMAGEKGDASGEIGVIPISEHIRVANRFLKCSRKIGQPSQLPKEKQSTLRRDLKPVYEWLRGLFEQERLG